MDPEGMAQGPGSWSPKQWPEQNWTASLGTLMPGPQPAHSLSSSRPGHYFLAGSHRKQTCLVSHTLASLLGADVRQREARSQQVKGAPNGCLPHPAGIRTDSEDRVSCHCWFPCSSWQLPLQRQSRPALPHFHNGTWLRLACRRRQSPKINAIDRPRFEMRLVGVENGQV